MSISGSILNSLIKFRDPIDYEALDNEARAPDEVRITEIRRAPGKVLIAEIGFIAVIPFALLEAAFMNIARIFTCFLNGETSGKIHSWASNSAYALLSAIVALVTNLFCFQMLDRPPDEEPAAAPGAPRPLPTVNQNPNPASPLILPRPAMNPIAYEEAAPTNVAPVITGTTFAKKVLSLYESIYTTDELKRYRDALATGDDGRSVYNEALEWREIQDSDVSVLEPLARPAPIPQTIFPNIGVPLGSGGYTPFQPAPAFSIRARQPVAQPMALPVLDPHRKELYNKYKLAPNATRISEVFGRMFARLPNPTWDQRKQLRTVTIPAFLETMDISKDRMDISKDRIALKLEAGTAEWQDRTLRLLWAIFEKIPQIKCADEVEIIRELTLQAFSNCSNRMSAEVERMYYNYVARDLIDLYENALTAEECLIYELTQHRMDVRDLVVNTECNDAHNAASHNYFRRELNANVFHLPPAPLSGEDDHYQSYAMQNKREDVIASFNRLYSPEGILSFVEQMLTDTGKDKVYKFKPAMFLHWLGATNRMNADSFEDEDMQKYKPEVVVAFLEELNFIRAAGEPIVPSAAIPQPAPAPFNPVRQPIYDPLAG